MLLTTIKGNPRSQFKNHKERGPRKYIYTTVDLAKLFNTTPGTIRYWASKRRFNPADLHSIISFWNQRNQKAQ